MKYERIIFLAALALYAVAAWYSTGFYHGDEHYQLIEYAAYKMGNVAREDLAWEFEARVRPALQPLIAYSSVSAMEALSLDDPYLQAFILRLLTAITALLSIRFFTRTCRGMVAPGYFKWYLFLSYFLWFLPFVNVRFSSETWSGIMILNAISVSIGKELRWSRMYVAGGFLGLGFLFRYQTAFLALGLILWLVFIKKERVTGVIRLLSAGLALLLMGMLADYWLYGNWVLPAWNYFYINLVEGIASGYGTEAWWNYFYSIFRFGFFPIGIMVIISFLVLIIKRPGNVFVWTILPFFVIHSIIPHKELRFLFPVINLVPIIMVLAYQDLGWDILRWKKARRLAVQALALVLLAINGIGAVTVSLKPADNGFAAVTQYIRQHYGREPIRLISYHNSNPYGPWGLMASFYMEQDMEDIRLASLNELDDTLLSEHRINLLVLKREDAEAGPALDFIEGQQAQKVTQCVPAWMEPLLTLYGGFRMREILELYELTN